MHALGCNVHYISYSGSQLLKFEINGPMLSSKKKKKRLKEKDLGIKAKFQSHCSRSSRRRKPTEWEGG